MSFKDELQKNTVKNGGQLKTNVLEANVAIIKQRMTAKSNSGDHEYSGNVRYEPGLYGSESDIREAMIKVSKDEGIDLQFRTNSFGANWFFFTW